MDITLLWGSRFQMRNTRRPNRRLAGNLSLKSIGRILRAVDSLRKDVVKPKIVETFRDAGIPWCSSIAILSPTRLQRL